MKSVYYVYRILDIFIVCVLPANYYDVYSKSSRRLARDGGGHGARNEESTGRQRYSATPIYSQ